jgi:hypothetical protein
MARLIRSNHVVGRVRKYYERRGLAVLGDRPRSVDRAALVMNKQF